MNPLTIVMTAFSMIAALDRIFGGKLGLAAEFERGIMMMGSICLSMIGMIVISPFLADVLEPVCGFVSTVLHIDPSIIPATLFANDMGGAPLAKEIALNEEIGMFNALVVSAMMGATVSFTVPVALGMVDKTQHRELLLGLLCGIVTIPLGCLVSGVILKLPLAELLINLLPLVLFSALIGVGLMLWPDVCVRIFSAFGTLIKALITVGLALGILKYLTGVELIKGLETFEEGGLICLNACAVMTGAFPMMNVLGRLLKKPMRKLGERLRINEASVMGMLSSLATSMTTFGMMKEMDGKGVLLNSAFAVSAAFTFAGHLAFTMAFDADYIFPVIIGKLAAGVLALVVAAAVHRRLQPKGAASAE